MMVWFFTREMYRWFDFASSGDVMMVWFFTREMYRWFGFDPREMLTLFGFSLGRCTDGLILLPREKFAWNGLILVPRDMLVEMV